MPRSILFSVALIVVGVVLLIWGLTASESFASDVSEVVEGTPSSKSMTLIVIGALTGVAGIVGLVRGRS